MLDDDNKTKLMVFILFLVLILAFIYATYKPVDAIKNNKKNSEQTNDIKNSDSQRNIINRNTETSVNNNTVYKLTDKHGVVHFSDTVSIKNSDSAQVISVNPNINVLQGIDSIPHQQNDRHVNKITRKLHDETLAYEKLCQRHTKGSIPYRDCRREVHLSLKEQCFIARGRVTNAPSEQYQSFKNESIRICNAYDKFVVVD